MSGIIILIIMALVFLVIGIVMLKGKGSFLIAGYNTSSKVEKEKYDEKKLCKATGMVCVVSCIMICILTIFCWRVEYCGMPEKDLLPVSAVFCIVILLTVIADIIYTNKYCKKK